MSEAVKQVTGKSFSSKSLSHLQSYSVVKTISAWLLSFTVVNYFYQRLAGTLGYVNENFISKQDGLYKALSFVDLKIDGVVLKKVDWAVEKTPDLSKFNPFVVYKKSVEKVNTKYLSPANSFIYSTYDKYLPATLTENKAAFKFEELKETSEISKFIKIVNEFLTRARLFSSNKSSQLSNDLVTSYNKEVELLAEKSSALPKNVVASYNTGKKVVKGFNDDYIKPLRNQTSDYVAEIATTTKNKADSLLSDAKQSISPKLAAVHTKGEELLNGAKPAANGNIPVSASA